MSDVDDLYGTNDPRVCADIVAHLDRTGANKACESCGHEDWAILEEAGNSAGLPTYGYEGYTNEGSPLPYHFPVVMVVCSHCALVRLYLRELIDKKNADAKNG